MKLSHQNDNFFTYRGLEDTKIDGTSINQFITDISTNKLKFALFLQKIKLQKKSKVFLIRLFSGEAIPEMKIDNYKEIGKDIVSHLQNISFEDFIKFSFLRKLFSNFNMSDIERIKEEIEEEIIRRFYDLIMKHFSELGIHPKLQERIYSDFEHVDSEKVAQETQSKIINITKTKKAIGDNKLI